MSNQHTPEPWRTHENYSGAVFYKEQWIAVCSEPQSEANARRIVACVNACAGIPTESLEQSSQNGSLKVLARNIELEQQRDELLALLERWTVEPDTYPFDTTLQSETLAAIAKVKGAA